MLYAISEDPENPKVSIAGVDWAYAFADHQTRRMLYMADQFVYESQYDEAAKKLLRIIGSRKDGLRHVDLLRRSHMDRGTFDKVVETLLESEQIIKTESESGRRKGLVYALNQ